MSKFSAEICHLFYAFVFTCTLRRFPFSHGFAISVFHWLSWSARFGSGEAGVLPRNCLVFQTGTFGGHSRRSIANQIGRGAIVILRQTQSLEVSGLRIPNSAENEVWRLFDCVLSFSSSPWAPFSPFCSKLQANCSMSLIFEVKPSQLLYSVRPGKLFLPPKSMRSSRPRTDLSVCSNRMSAHWPSSILPASAVLYSNLPWKSAPKWKSWCFP